MSTDLPPPPPPSYPPPLYPPYTGAPPLEPGGRRNFLIGLGLGLIPGIVASIGISGALHTPFANTFANLIGVGTILYVVTLVAWIVLVSIPRTRRIGQGMLTGWVIDPVFVFISCVVILTASRGVR